jgi:hypothetical protein
MILIRYYQQTSKTKALYKSIDGLAGWLADNWSNPDGLGIYYWTIPELKVQVYWQPGPTIWQWFGWDPDSDQQSSSGTVANTTPSVSPDLVVHGLGVHLLVHPIMASKCISDLAWSQLLSGSPNSLNFGFQVCMSMASKFMPKLTRPLPPSASLC